MATITQDSTIVTLINVFTVTPDNQQRLVNVLVEATEATMNKLPGFISANIHKSLDGTRVTNYAQWASKEAFEAMQHNPEVRSHMQAAMQLATFDAHLYEVVFTDSMR